MRHPITHLIRSAIHGTFRVTHGLTLGLAQPNRVPDPDGYAVIYTDPYTQRLVVRDAFGNPYPAADVFAVGNADAFADAYAEAYGLTPAERDELADAFGHADGPGH